MCEQKMIDSISYDLMLYYQYIRLLVPFRCCGSTRINLCFFGCIFVVDNESTYKIEMWVALGCVERTQNCPCVAGPPKLAVRVTELIAWWYCCRLRDCSWKCHFSRTAITDNSSEATRKTSKSVESGAGSESSNSRPTCCMGAAVSKHPGHAVVAACPASLEHSR